MNVYPPSDATITLDPLLRGRNRSSRVRIKVSIIHPHLFPSFGWSPVRRGQLIQLIRQQHEHERNQLTHSSKKSHIIPEIVVVILQAITRTLWVCVTFVRSLPVGATPIYEGSVHDGWGNEAEEPDEDLLETHSEGSLTFVDHTEGGVNEGNVAEERGDDKEENSDGEDDEEGTAIGTTFTCEEIRWDEKISNTNDSAMGKNLAGWTQKILKGTINLGLPWLDYLYQ